MADKTENLDWVRELLRMVSEMQPSFTEDMASQIEWQFKQENGGEKVYIPKKLAVDEKRKAQAVKTYIDEGPKAACSRYGMSRATLYRILKK